MLWPVSLESDLQTCNEDPGGGGVWEVTLIFFFICLDVLGSRSVAQMLKDFYWCQKIASKCYTNLQKRGRKKLKKDQTDGEDFWFKWQIVKKKKKKYCFLKRRKKRPFLLKFANAFKYKSLWCISFHKSWHGNLVNLVLQYFVQRIDAVIKTE